MLWVSVRVRELQTRREEILPLRAETPADV